MAANRRLKNSIYIDHIDEVLRDIDASEEILHKADRVYRTLAAKEIESMAKLIARGVGRQQARASQDVRARSGGTVVYGGLDWSFGAEFGSYVYDQFPEWRGNSKDAGYFFWPAVNLFTERDMLDLWIMEVWDKVAKKVAGE